MLALNISPMYDICKFGGAIFENGTPKGAKRPEHADTEEGDGIPSIRLLPRAPPASATDWPRRFRLFRIYISSIGYWRFVVVVGGAMGDFGKWETGRPQKRLETRIPFRRLKFLAPV